LSRFVSRINLLWVTTRLHKDKYVNKEHDLVPLGSLS